MKKILLLCTILALFSKHTNAQDKIQINTSNSTIQWFGEYTFYFGGHDGYIDFKEGHLITKEDRIVGGSFVIDMESISNTDIKKDDARQDLIRHLKDPDFFDVDNYPSAKLEFTKVEYKEENNMRIEANLTVKGKTLPINFRADYNPKNHELQAQFKIDRMRWGVSYNSKLRDGAISDAIGFKVKVGL